MQKPKILWIDGVGGYAMCDAREVSLGQSFPSNEVDLAIRGDLSRRAAIFRRSGDGHWVQALQGISICGTQIERATLLADGDLLDFGNRLLISYKRPTKLSGTGRLEIESQHRWQPSLSGALLLGESCILGADPSSHVHCSNWRAKIVLFRHQGDWMVRVFSNSPVFVGNDPEPVSAPFPILLGQRVHGDDFSMTLATR
ncbi:MAG: hypothetical protein FJ308_07995 [Planctomycetes bacterium]|nr:hypothetical protein [Planctomycetota bacterium]